MADRADPELDELWNEFHAVVNMTSRELNDWLLTDAASDTAEEVPDQAGAPDGRRVLEILGKRRMDLTDGDVSVMREVVSTVTAERGEGLDDPEAGTDPWRHRLMNLGHDPLRPLASDEGVSRVRQRHH